MCFPRYKEIFLLNVRLYLEQSFVYLKNKKHFFPSTSANFSHVAKHSGEGLRDIRTCAATVIGKHHITQMLIQFSGTHC